MKKLFIIFSFIFINFAIQAQTTAVSMTIVDPSSQVWANGFFTYTFSPAPGYSGPYQWQGANLPANYLTATTMSLDSGGSASFNLPDNSQITPAGSGWKFVVCSNTSYNCSTIRIAVSGTSNDISPLINGQINTITLPATTFPRAYTNSEIITSPTLGGLYYDTTLGCLKFWNGSVFTCLSVAIPTLYQVNGVSTSLQNILNFEGTDSSITVSNPSGGNVNFQLSSTLRNTLCLANGTNCPPCSSISGCASSASTTTINTVTCALNGSCTIPIAGTTTINGTACALNGSCSITGTFPAASCNSYGCFLQFPDGTTMSWGTVTMAPSGNSYNDVTITYPYTYTTNAYITITPVGTTGTGDTTTPPCWNISTSSLTTTSVYFAKCIVAGAGGGNFDYSMNVNFSIIGK